MTDLQLPEAPADPPAPVIDDTPLTDEEREAERDAENELRRLEEASVAAAPAPVVEPGRYTAPVPVERGYARPMPPLPAVIPGLPRERTPAWGADAPAPLVRETRPVQTTLPMGVPRKITALEDLYAAHPEIGDGVTYMRIERVEPRKWRGVDCKGVIEDVFDRISMDEFKDRFGGQKYIVTVFGPKRRATGGESPIVSLGVGEITLIGPPAMGAVPREEHEYMTARQPGPGRGPGQSPFYPHQEPTEIALERLRQEAAEKTRLEDARRRMEDEMRANAASAVAAARPPPEFIDAFREANEKTVQVTEARHRELVETLRTSHNEALRALREKEAKLEDSQTKVVDLQRQVAEAQRFSETEQIRQLKDRQEAELKRLMMDQSQKIDQLNTDHRRQLDDEARRHTEERTRLETEASRERERLREDAARREKQVQEDYERQYRSMKDTYDGRLQDLTTRTEAQVREVKEQREREVRSTKELEESKATYADKTAKYEISSARGQVADMRDELSTLRRENEELRRSAHKTPQEFIAEVKAFGPVIGLVPADEVKGPKSEGWGDVVRQVAGSLIEAAPKALAGLQETRQQNQAAHQQAAHQAQMQQHQAQMQQQAPPSILVQQAPPQAARQRPRVMAARPPAWAQPTGVPPASGAPSAGIPAPSPFFQASAPAPQTAPFPGGGAVVEHRPPDGVSHVGGDPVRVASSPVQVQSVQGEAKARAAEAAAQASAQADADAQALAVQAAQLQQEALANASPADAINLELAQEFVGQLEGAIRSHGVITEETFARNFVERLGPERVRTLLSAIDISTFFRTVESSGQAHRMELMTIEGKAYATKVWRLAAELAAAGG